MTKMWQQKGRLGQDIAEKFLVSKGFWVVRRNFYIRGGEIDLVMENDHTILFVEVKIRSSDRFGVPNELITPVKRRALTRAILTFLSQQNSEHQHKKTWRADLIAIKMAASTAHITHIKNIFLT